MLLVDVSMARGATLIEEFYLRRCRGHLVFLLLTQKQNSNETTDLLDSIKSIRNAVPGFIFDVHCHI